MNIQDIILKSREYEKVEIHRYSLSIDTRGREKKTLSKIGSYTMSVQPVNSENLSNSHAGEQIDGDFTIYLPVVDIKTKDLIKRVEADGLFYEVRKIEVQDVKPVKLSNGNILDLSHIKAYVMRIDNQ